MTAPMPTNSTGQRPYARHVALTTWPQLRRRATRSGALGRHRARVSSQTTIAIRTPRTTSAQPGSSIARPSAREPRSMAEQKKSVARGAERAARRHRVAEVAPARRSSAIGCVHCVFRFGPVGPL